MAESVMESLGMNDWLSSSSLIRPSISFLLSPPGFPSLRECVSWCVLILISSWITRNDSSCNRYKSRFCCWRDLQGVLSPLFFLLFLSLQVLSSCRVTPLFSFLFIVCFVFFSPPADLYYLPMLLSVFLSLQFVECISSLFPLQHLTFFPLYFPRYQSLTSFERDLSWLLTLYSLSLSFLIHWHFRNEGKPRKYRSPRRCFLCFSVCSEYFSCLMSSSLTQERKRERFLGVFAWIPTSLSLSFLLLFSLESIVITQFRLIYHAL